MSIMNVSSNWSAPISRSQLSIVFLLLVAVFACFNVIRFALAQEVWIDETTQLTGISLPFGEMIAWLAGAPRPEFLVPPDRMPPGSYVVDWVWSQFFSDSPLQLRLLHAGILSASIIYLTRALHQNFGFSTAVAFFAIAATSPTLTNAAVEIRAYPIFVALTCVSIVQFLKALEAEGRAFTVALTKLSMASALAIWTHYFALIATGGFFAALLMQGILTRKTKQLYPILICGLALAIISGLLLPFIGAAIELSSRGSSVSSVPSISFGEVASYFLRLIGHASHLVFPILGAIYFLGWAGLLAVACKVFLSSEHMFAPNTPNPLKKLFWLLVAASAGVAVTIAAAFVLDGFDAMKASYSIWVTPALFAAAAMLIGGVFPLVSYRIQMLITVSVSLVVLANIAASSVISLRPNLFAHGPGDSIAGMIERDATSMHAELIYEPSASAEYAAYPIQWRFGENYVQWKTEKNGVRLNRFVHGPLEQYQESIDRIIASEEIALVVDVEKNRFDGIAWILFNPKEFAEPGEVSLRFLRAPNWELRETKSFGGFYRATVRRFERVDND